jgi:hypothetical protein
VRRRDQFLQRPACRGAQFESIDDVKPELDQARTEMEPSAAVLRQVAA